MPELLGETNIGIIILKRPAAQIADSYIRKHTSPLRQQGREWITSPTKKNPLVKPPILFLTPRISMVVGRLIKNLIRPFRKDAHKASVLPEWLVNYEKACIEWYVHETNAETERFRKKFPNIRYYEVEISELNSMENVNKMLDFFGWKAMGSMASVVGKATNQKIPKTAK